MGRVQAQWYALGAVPAVVSVTAAEAATTFDSAGCVVALLNPHRGSGRIVDDGVGPVAATSVAVFERPLVDDEFPLVDDVPCGSVTVSQVAPYLVRQLVAVFVVVVVVVRRHGDGRNGGEWTE